MRKVAYTALAVLSVLVLAIWSWRLSPLLPERGGAICFAAGYDPPRPVDLSSPRLDHRSAGEVSAMRLEISLSPDERPFRDERSGRGYDWRYSLRLKAELADSSHLSTAASCEFRDSFVDRMMPALSCYIDCDGGSVTIWRRIGQSALSARIEAKERLKTGDGCGAGSTIFIGADREPRSFPAELVAAEQCK
jgi:hypothetical protein